MLQQLLLSSLIIFILVMYLTQNIPINIIYKVWLHLLLITISVGLLTLQGYYTGKSEIEKREGALHGCIIGIIIYILFIVFIRLRR